ncbi:hypothetical protein O181_004817 [Austropuccinia psidii MF-1]|uniref:Uncharacterized protein n=1 Tax=Austropuccinia psidii MF-1 TaxID=1389203 RepID=A0A9Q3GG59_9BASI|nr:hypothetical protein [Austropuccinia psidii MF-1]
MPQTLGNATEFNELQTVTPERGRKISDMVSSNELGIEVESLAHANNQDPPVFPECDKIINLEVNEGPPADKLYDETLPASPQNIQASQERDKLKHDTMGQDMSDRMPEPEPEVSTSLMIKYFLS